jgi:UDP-N-acetylglucosamine--N-acetylmuramyl-(pentapeptide) pyrophosphoryl-undecaprenol N-acetylglucosamine transferase
MTKTPGVVLIMAGGTGGHIFPALSIAERLKDAGVRVEWLGAKQGMECELVPKAGYPLHIIAVRGVVGKSMISMLIAPFMLLHATYQAMRVMNSIKPICVLGMGGYVSGPGGIAAWLMRRKLYIHEQNAVPGVTNRILARFAICIMEAFPGTFLTSSKVVHTGNPVRREIAAIAKNANEIGRNDRPLRILVLGGSQGAQAINELIPEVLHQWHSNSLPEIVHQTGAKYLLQTRNLYQMRNFSLGEAVDVRGFIDNMPAIYQWADLMIGRSGASTVCELAVAGLPAILIPYPHHRDKQQLLNANWLADEGGALIIQQQDLNVVSLAKVLQDLDTHRDKLSAMSMAARSKGMSQADEVIATLCLKAIKP